MDCIYLTERKKCVATPSMDAVYSPSENEIKEYCSNTSASGFPACPRLLVYHEYLKVKKD